MADALFRPPFYEKGLRNYGALNHTSIGSIVRFTSLKFQHDFYVMVQMLDIPQLVSDENFCCKLADIKSKKKTFPIIRLNFIKKVWLKVE